MTNPINFESTNLPLDMVEQPQESFEETMAPMIEEITQNVPICPHELTQAVNQVKEAVSIDGKISLSLLMAELKRECDKLDYLNSEMTNKSQIKSEKKIKGLAQDQSKMNTWRGNAAATQMLALVLVSIYVAQTATITTGNNERIGQAGISAMDVGVDNGRLIQEQMHSRLSDTIRHQTEMTNQLIQQIGGVFTSYTQGWEAKYRSAEQLEQAKYSDRNQKAQNSQANKQDRAQMLQGLLQAQLSAARS